jgi:acyl-CoA synthetase (AMP-forming)/AMP-acid ligase II
MHRTFFVVTRIRHKPKDEMKVYPKLETYAEDLRRSLPLHRERPAAFDSERNFTWAQFGYREARAAAVLSSLGSTRGARHGSLRRNSIGNNELMRAGNWMGVVPVPVNDCQRHKNVVGRSW